MSAVEPNGRRWDVADAGQAGVSGWAVHQETPASVVAVSSRTKDTAIAASAAARCWRYHVLAVAPHTVCPRLAVRRAYPGETSGGAETLRKPHAGRAGPPFAGPGSSRWPCRPAGPLPCNGRMHNAVGTFVPEAAAKDSTPPARSADARDAGPS